MHPLLSEESTWCKIRSIVYSIFGIGAFSLVFLISPAYGQLAPQTDSLHTLLQKTIGDQRAEVLINLSHQIRRTNIDSAIIYAQQALSISGRLDDESLQAKSHNNLGRFFTDNGRYPEALKHLLQAKTIFEQIGDLHSEALALQNLGILYRSQSNYGKSLEYYFRALSLEEQLNNRHRIANILINIGSLYYQMDRPEESIKFYERALGISEQAGNASDIAIIATDMGKIYVSLNDMEHAEKSYQKALEASEELPGAHAKATILMNLSSVYNDERSYQKALEINNQALSLAREMSDKMLESWALENIAITHRGLGNYAKANSYLLQAMPIIKEIGKQKSEIRNQTQIARNYYNMAEYEKSISNATQAVQAAKEGMAFVEGSEALQLLVQAYQQTGDYNKAIVMQQNLIAWKDSLFDRQKSQQIAEMQTRYETKQKEQEIALLQQEKEKAELIRNAFIAGLLLIFIIGFLIYNRQRLKIKNNKADLENTRLKEKQLKQDLAFKNKQLTTHSLHLVQKNETMKELKENLGQIRNGNEKGLDSELQSLENLIDYSFNLDEDWEEFRLYFEEVHTGFFDTLKDQYPDLTPNELRLSALVKLNLTIKEIATILSIIPDSVKTARYRLRKKLDLETEENLTHFLMQVEKEVLD